VRNPSVCQALRKISFKSATALSPRDAIQVVELDRLVDCVPVNHSVVLPDGDLEHMDVEVRLDGVYDIEKGVVYARCLDGARRAMPSGGLRRYLRLRRFPQSH